MATPAAGGDDVLVSFDLMKAGDRNMTLHIKWSDLEVWGANQEWKLEPGV